MAVEICALSTELGWEEGTLPGVSTVSVVPHGILSLFVEPHLLSETV